MAFKSLRYNFLLNLVNTLAGLLFPLITFPYVARVLDPDGLGLVSFYQSTIQYITILSSLGITLYGVREVARIKDDPVQRSRATVELLLLHLGLSLIGYIAVGILCLTVGRFSAHAGIFLILSVTIFFNALGVGWFYSGMEEFRYITVRSLLFKLVGAVALFVFVKSPADITVYAVILVVADIGNNIFNILRLRRYIRAEHLQAEPLRVMRHLRPAFTIFTLNVIIGLYAGFTPIIIGMISNDEAVGFYIACSRLTAACLSIVTALGTTLLPRMSYYIHHGDTEAFSRTARRGLNFLIALSLPITVGLVITAGEIIPVFSGPMFAPAIVTLKILAPVIFIVGIAGITGYQILYPMGHERLIIRASLAGAVFFLPAGCLLTYLYSQNGGAIAYVATELIISIFLGIYSNRYFRYNYLARENMTAAASTLVMAAALIVLRHAVEMPALKLLCIEIAAGVATFGLSMAAMRHPLMLELLDTVKTKRLFNNIC